MKRIGIYLAWALGLSVTQAQAAPPAEIDVMIVGNFHMSNPGKDLLNAKVDDVLSPERQAQIKSVNAALAKFRPTKIAAEWPAKLASEIYTKYRAGTLKPQRNEVVQLGFRLADTMNLKTVYGIDVAGDFPYEPVEAYAKAHGQDDILTNAHATIAKSVAAQDRIMATGTVAAALRFLNDPAEIANDNAFYRDMLKIGGGSEQPGADLLSAWYRRNFLICANLVQMAKPGDRVVVFYGAGHAFLLRQCVKETPGFKLIEPNAYLPK